MSARHRVGLRRRTLGAWVLRWKWDLIAITAAIVIWGISVYHYTH